MGTDEITVMATYSIPTALIEHWVEVWRCTREYAIKAIIRTNEPSTIREMTFDNDERYQDGWNDGYVEGYDEGLDHCDCGVC